VAPLYHEAGLLLVAPIVSDPKLTESGWSNVFRFTNRDDATANAIAGYMTRRLQKNVRSRGLHHLMATGDRCWDVRNFLEPASEAAEQGEGVLVLSACPEVGTVSGSTEFSARYERQFGPIRNYAVNSFDATTMLLSAIGTIAASASGRPNRRQILEAMRQAEYQGIACSEAVRWRARGDNSSAVTALHSVKDRKFREVALVPQHVPN
jgi:branched-chain amino acid transport system substrate-binding protein